MTFRSNEFCVRDESEIIFYPPGKLRTVLLTFPTQHAAIYVYKSVVYTRKHSLRTRSTCSRD